MALGQTALGKLGCCSACNSDPRYRATSIAYRADRRATHAPNNSATRPEESVPIFTIKTCNRANYSHLLHVT